MKLNSTSKFAIVIFAGLGASLSMAQSKVFTIDNQKLAYRNVATVESVSEFETFTGKTNGVSGFIKFDPTTRKGGGKIMIDVASIDTGIPLRNEHMKSEGWLNAAKYPNITFEALSRTKKGKDMYSITGTLSLHGVTKTITVPVRLRYREAGAATKAAGFSGDVVQLNTRFPIMLSDYGIMIPDMAKGKVSNEVTLSLSTYAIAN